MTVTKGSQARNLLQKLLRDNAAYMKTRKNANKKIYVEQDSAFSKLYRYAEASDIALMVVGTLAAMTNGIVMPFSSLLFGDLSAAFLSQEKYANDPAYRGGTATNTSLPEDFITQDEFLETTSDKGLYYVYIGTFVCTLTFIQNICWEKACCNQIFKLRQVFFAQAMRQEIPWFDERENEDLTNKITDDMERMRDGLGSKVPLLLQSVSLLFAGLALGFYYSWRLTSVIMIGGPVVIISSAFTAAISAGASQREQLRYGVAGGIASETLTSLRTVSAYGGEEREIQRFKKAVMDGKKLATKKYYYLSGSMAISSGLMYAIYGMGLWYGGQLFIEDKIRPEQIFTVFMCVISGALGIGNSLPNIVDISTAIGVSINVFEIIDNVPKIDPYSKEGQSISGMKGEIEFKNVYFSYPLRPQVMVLSGLNLTIPSGKVVAVVGSSGAGKSTLVSLILRFYDPLCGKVLVDDLDVAELNIQNFRNQIGVVSQEPVLFDVSIKENIRYGKPDATQAEIEEAARIAFADTFIEGLPKGYDTLVGERGVQLSGGQKQRIAIARAVIRKPKILLLDEATSALDSHSENIVQAALENAARGRTTLIIAHRLSTVRNADVIHAMKNGQVAESGTHEELMEKKGIYYNLVLAQTQKTSESEETDKVEVPEENPKEIMSRMMSFKRFTMKRLSSKVSKGSISKNDDDEVSYFKLLSVTDSPWKLIYTCLACFFAGFQLPTFAFLYGGILEMFTLPTNEFITSIALWSIYFIILAFFTAIAMSSSVLLSSILTEDTIGDLRVKTFKNILSQQLAFFDEDKYSAIHLTNALAKDPPMVKNIAGMRAGLIIISSVSTTLSLGIAFYCGWRIALIVLCFVPLVVFGNWIQMRMKFKSIMERLETTARVAKISSECLQNIKTVQFLGLQEYMLSVFMDELKISHKDEVKQAYVFSSSIAIVTATVFFMYGTTFKFGSKFVDSGYMSANDIYRTVFALAFASSQLGSSLIFFQDFGKGKVAVSSIYKIMTLPTKLNVFSKEGDQPVITGNIEFRDVSFSYPTRRHVQILQGLSLKIPQGMTVALVGGSGCGKSTLINLIERFYNTKKGDIGYETKVGERGGNLSGGQKQRIAIARALLRDPKILLLDEATSALDTESEKVVQEALDKAREGRTSIVIAHRLSTVQNADLIAVIAEGRVVELGTHTRLMELRGHYYDLVKHQ